MPQDLKSIGGPATPSGTAGTGLTDSLKGIFEQVKNTGKALGLDKNRIYQTASAIAGKFKDQQNTGAPANNQPVSPNGTGGPSQPLYEYTPPDQRYGSGFTPDNFLSEYSALRRNAGIDLYSNELNAVYSEMRAFRNNEDKYVANKQFGSAIAKLNNQKYMVRPKLIEKYKAQGLDAVTIEKLINGEVGSIDNEINMLEETWQGQMREYKATIDDMGINIQQLNTSLRLAQDNVTSGMGSYKDAFNVSKQLYDAQEEHQQAQTSLWNTIEQIDRDGGDSSALRGQTDIYYNPKTALGSTRPFRKAQYSFGGNSPAKTDCSGLTQQAWKTMYGVDVPHNAAAQFNSDKGVQVDMNNLQPGDLVFLRSPMDFRVQNGTMPEGQPTHVGMFTENGTIIHSSPNNPNQGVSETDREEFMRGSQVLGARRVNPKFNKPFDYGYGTGANGELVKRRGELKGDFEKRVYDTYLNDVTEQVENGEMVDYRSIMKKISSTVDDSNSTIKNRVTEFAQIIASSYLENFPDSLAENDNDLAETIKDFYLITGGSIKIDKILRKVFENEDIIKALPEDQLKLLSSGDRKYIENLKEELKERYPNFFGEIDTTYGETKKGYIGTLVSNLLPGGSSGPGYQLPEGALNEDELKKLKK